MTTEFTYTPLQVDAAVDLVIAEGALREATPVTYAALFSAAGLEDHEGLDVGDEGENVATFMKSFHDRCAERDLPPLDCLVVHGAGFREGKPGAAYFGVNNQPDPFFGAGPAERVARGRRFLETQQRTVRSWGSAYAGAN